MRFCNAFAFSFPLVLLPLSFFLAATYLPAEKDVPLPTSSAVDFRQFWRSAVKKAMNETHVFVSPNHPYIHYVGRWVPSADQLMREAGFPGAYFEFGVTNTTSVYLAFQSYPGFGAGPGDPLDVEDNIGVTVEIDDELLLMVLHPCSIVQVAENLDPSRTYKLRVTQTAYYQGADGSFKFEGVWLDRPASEGHGRPAVGSTLGALVPQTEGPQGATQQQDSPPALRKKSLIELFTCEVDLELNRPSAQKNAAGLAEERVHTWYNRFGAELGADIALVPTTGKYFSQDWFGIKSDNRTTAPVAKYFFSYRYEGESSFSSISVNQPKEDHSWPFKAYRPAVLILQLGFTDFIEIFKGLPAQQHLDEFLNSFVKDYVKFVKTIRADAYPSDGTTANGGDDGSYSYTYNSAPSTLPIFLIAPFSAHRVLVTRKLTLAKFMADALARVVSTLHAEGDISTHLIDTAGWLDPQQDFQTPPNFRRLFRPRVDGEAWRPLTEAAKVKVASLLASHICPYIKQSGQSSVDGSAGISDSNSKSSAVAFAASGDCAFDQYDSYLGNVYVPEGVELDRALLERKFEIIKERFRLATPVRLKIEPGSLRHKWAK
ncbi:hypothetical protein A1O7_03270 [Cladophialophora yegresii CBS 114405]|uniref:Uncharacterized protein n=1 Tax=Cladophialophora yegresii CBS 114405 TaxID=1182544 RepID=W9WCW2_9EURO|nr:uncharacterized protein A1O7_03270 [Cladophialophora yegresii CBS 114405]EXJ62830.1 hypothetical protein A1O7_03270 [Cladophialophora yegresii CBS 114405]